MQERDVFVAHPLGPPSLPTATRPRLPSTTNKKHKTKIHESFSLLSLLFFQLAASTFLSPAHQNAGLGTASQLTPHFVTCAAACQPPAPSVPADQAGPLQQSSKQQQQQQQQQTAALLVGSPTAPSRPARSSPQPEVMEPTQPGWCSAPALLQPAGSCLLRIPRRAVPMASALVLLRMQTRSRGGPLSSALPRPPPARRAAPPRLPPPRKAGAGRAGGSGGWSF